MYLQSNLFQNVRKNLNNISTTSTIQQWEQNLVQRRKLFRKENDWKREFDELDPFIKTFTIILLKMMFRYIIITHENFMKNIDLYAVQVHT